MHFCRGCAVFSDQLNQAAAFWSFFPFTPIEEQAIQSKVLLFNKSSIAGNC
jgi:hypothetical protein